MARATTPLCEVLSAKMVWNRNVGQYVPISAAQEHDQLGKRKRLDSLDVGCCFHSADDIDSSSNSREALGRLDRMWQCLWGWISVKKKGLCFCTKGKLMLRYARSAWRHLFWKLRAEFRKMMNPRPIQRFKYDALSYAQNFDDGCWKDQEIHPVSLRFAPTSSAKPCC
eukprot:Gb_41760 [translate_table: standard]